MDLTPLQNQVKGMNSSMKVLNGSPRSLAFSFRSSLLLMYLYMPEQNSDCSSGVRNAVKRSREILILVTERQTEGPGNDDRKSMQKVQKFGQICLSKKPRLFPVPLQ